MKLSRSLLREVAGFGLVFLGMTITTSLEAQTPASRFYRSPVTTRRFAIDRAPRSARPSSIRSKTPSVAPSSNREWSTGRSVPLAKPWMRPLNP